MLHKLRFRGAEQGGSRVLPPFPLLGHLLYSAVNEGVNVQNLAMAEIKTHLSTPTMLMQLPLHNSSDVTRFTA